MTESKPDYYDEMLVELQAEYLAQPREQEILEALSAAEVDRALLGRLAHRIAGMAATFGLQELGIIARRLEKLVDAWEGGEQGKARLLGVAHLLAEATQAARRGAPLREYVERLAST